MERDGEARPPARTAGAASARVRRLLLGTIGTDTKAAIAEAPPVPVREVFRRFWPYARPYAKWLVLSLVFVAINPMVETATIWMFKRLVDEVLVPGNLGPFGWIAAGYLGLTLLGGFVSFFDDYLSTLVAQRFLLSLRTSFFRHLQALSLDFYQKRPLGDVLSRLTGDVAAIESLMLSGVASIVSYVFRIIFFAAALFYVQWQLALVSLIITPLFWVAARYFTRLLKRASRELRRRSGSLTAVAEESLSNVVLAQAYNRQEEEVHRFHEQGEGKVAAEMASTRLKGLFSPVVDLIQVVGILVVVGFGAWAVSTGTLTLGGLLAFMAYLSKLYSPIRGLARLANSIYSASASAERIIEFLDEQPHVRERRGAVALRRVRGEIEFQDVSFRYPGAERDALRHVSFTARSGETVAFVGPSGAGKSTVARLLLRFYDPTAGRILLDGRDLRDIQLHALREHTAVVLQETLIFDGTIRENIAYGRMGASHKDVVRAARAADAHDFITQLPQGYDTVVGQKGQSLSGGQRQRIAIARAMVRDAPILLLDEPTTGLDVESGWKVTEPLRHLMRGRTTLVISHNLATVRDATRIVVLEEGGVAEEGTHEALLARDGTYARLYRLHMQPVRHGPHLSETDSSQPAEPRADDADDTVEADDAAASRVGQAAGAARAA